MTKEELAAKAAEERLVQEAATKAAAARAAGMDLEDFEAYYAGLPHP